MTMTSTTVVSAQELLDILPHRFPMLMLDRVIEIADDKIVAIKNVSAGEPFFVGHFPGVPVMPGVLMVEAMAQAGAVLAARTGAFDPARQVLLLMTIDKVKFRRQVTPGDQLVIEVVPLRRGRVWKLRGVCTVDGAVVCQAELLAGIGARDRG